VTQHQYTAALNLEKRTPHCTLLLRLHIAAGKTGSQHACVAAIIKGSVSALHSAMLSSHHVANVYMFAISEGISHQ